MSTSLHCCGNIEALMPDIIECGVDVFDPFQPEAMDIWGLHRSYGGRIAFWGGLSVQSTFPYGTPRENISAVIELARNQDPHVVPTY